MWLTTKTVLLLYKVLVVSSLKHEVLVSLMWKAHVKLNVSSKNEL
jgi:hypothetical protein